MLMEGSNANIETRLVLPNIAKLRRQGTRLLWELEV